VNLRLTGLHSSVLAARADSQHHALKSLLRGLHALQFRLSFQPDILRLWIAFDICKNKSVAVMELSSKLLDTKRRTS